MSVLKHSKKVFVGVTALIVIFLHFGKISHQKVDINNNKQIIMLVARRSNNNTRLVYIYL
jgi:hypothetical protein